MNLEKRWSALCLKYNSNAELIHRLWEEVKQHYEHRNRHYHNLEHLSKMFVLLDKYEREGAIEQVDAMSFAIYYHDIIYSVLRPNNEERSAALAKRRLQQLAVPLELQKKVVEMIEATKEHGFSSKSDVNYLLDFDLAVLGESESAYQEYTKNIRKEFSLFPNVVYKPARRKVLETFLSKGEIYHTDRFKKSRQLQAENNIKYEIRMLES